jgi:hypothetical protein
LAVGVASSLGVVYADGFALGIALGIALSA